MSDILQQIISRNFSSANEPVYTKMTPSGYEVANIDGSPIKPDVVGEVKKIPGIDIMPTGIDKYVLPYIFDFIVGVDDISSGFIDSFFTITDNIQGKSREEQIRDAELRKLRAPLFIQTVRNLNDLISNKYVDETGRELDIADLTREGKSGYAAELTLQNAFKSAPSTVISVINPKVGSAVLGLSTYGGNYYEDLKNRPDQTVDQIALNSVIAGGSEVVTELIGGRYLKGLIDIPGGGTNKKAVKEYTQGFVESFIRKVGGGAFVEAGTETLNAIIQESANVFVYDDDFSKKKYIDNIINASLPALLLGGKSGAIGAITQDKDKKNLYQYIAPKTWKVENFELGQKIFDLSKDVKNAPANEKQVIQKELDNLIKKRDKKLEDLVNSFENLTDKELKQYATNLDNINKNNNIIGNDRYSSTTQQNAEIRNLELIQENFDLVGKEYDATDIVTQKILGEAIRASEIIEKRLKKLKGINRDDLEVKILENQEQIDKLIEEGDTNFDEKADGMFVGKNKDGKAQIYINKQVASLEGATNVVGHELLHYMISRQFKTDNASMKPLVDDLKKYLEKNHSKEYALVQKRINDHYTDKNGNIKKGALEEYINVFSDLIDKQKIDLSDAKTSSLRNKFDSVLLGFGLQDVKIETAQDLVRFIKNYNNNINRQGLLGKLMGTRILDARIESSKLQKLDKPEEVETINKKSLSAEAKQQITESVKEIGSTYSFEGGKKSWDEGGADNAITEIKQNNYLDDLIAAKFKGDKVPVDFVDKVYTELTNHIRNFNPETNDNLFGWINSQLANKAGNVFNREYKTTVEQRTARDVDDRTKEGEIKTQVADETDVTLEALETQDISPQAEARRKREAAEKAEPTKSKLRQEIGIEDGSDAYNTVLDTARKVLIRAYDAGKTARQIQRDLTKEASTYLFKQVKNMLGTKAKYIPTIKKFRVPLIESMFTADLVQMERNVPDNERVFTKFVKKLTSKKEVQDAVNDNFLPPSALNTIDKGQSVSLYEKVMPTEEQFVAFFDQPLVNPKTGLRSGLRGTRKDQLAKYVAASLNYDATMQVAQEPEILQKRKDIADLKGDVLMSDDLQVLASTINRDINLKFSISSSDEVNVARKYFNKLKQESNFETKEKALSYIKNQYTSENIKPKELEQSSNVIYDIVTEIYNKRYFEESGDVKNPVLLQELIKRYKKLKSKKAKNIPPVYKMYEQIHLDILNQVIKGLGIEVNESVTEVDGANDIMISNKRGDVYSVEIKMDQARTVSETLNFKIINGKIVWESTKQELEIAKDSYSSIKDDLAKTLEKIIKLSKDPITNSSDGISAKDYKNLEIKRLLSNFWTESKVPLTKEAVVKRMVDKGNGGINVGESGFFLFENTGNDFIDNINTKVKNYIKQNYNIDVPYFKGDFKLYSQNSTSRRPKTKQNVGKHTTNVRLMSRIDNKVIGKSPLNLSETKDAKIFAEAVDNAMKFSKSQNVSNIENTIFKARSPLKYSKTSRGMSAFDFDETLIDKGENFILATSPDGDQVRISSGQWPIKGPELTDLGYTFDFKDFVNVRGGVDGPLLQKLKNRIKKYGAKNNYILTARPAESATAIHGWLKTKGINIPLENITGLGNSTGEAKAMWIAGKYSEGYNDIYFVDDALPNVKAVADVINQLDIKGKSVQAKIKFSKSLNKDFNKILEEVKGIDAKKRFSEAKGRARGRGKGRFRFFIPPSHEDFVGLLYNFIGKGAKGNKHRDFFEKALIRPLNRAYRELNVAKQAIANDYRALIKSMPDVRKRLSKKILKSDYTVEDAIRVYLFDKAGFEVPGLTKTDLKNLTNFVKENSDILQFADQVGKISRVEEGYVSPGDSWQGSNIRYDLVDATGRVGRAKFFTEYQENADIIFSDENINKIRAAFGDNFVEALKDMLYVNKTGSNRPTGNHRIVNNFLDWVNGSVGATMFFNARSAVLQTLSTVNFINFGDNNIFKAAAAFANQKQYWKDFSFLFNSDYLKQRRSGAAFDVNASEIAREVAGSKNPVVAATKYLLNIGFLPTQLADSFAIASGGSTFYRNRVNTYVKQGLSQKEAESKAFIDFQELAESTQQSARPDMVSQQQRSPLGRVILAFQNVTAQYARIIKKSGLDLVNRRISKGYTNQVQSDTANISRIIYYGAVQAIIFNALQNALFAMMFDEEEEDEEKTKKFFDTKKQRVINGTIDSLLKGMGVGGAVISTVKNYAIKLTDNLDNKSFFKTPAWEELLQLSPPIGIKIRKIARAERNLEWNKDVLSELPLDNLDNPMYDISTAYIEGFTNIPVARLLRKVQNLSAALDKENKWWQRVAVAAGWSRWDVGIQDNEINEIKKSIRENNRLINEEQATPEEKLKIIEKSVFDLNKNEQIKILEDNNLNPKRYPKESDRVNIIMKLRKINERKIDSTINAIKDYVPTKEEQRSIDLFKMNKKDQVNMLIDLGLSSKQIRDLKYEEDRVNKIIQLQDKSKSKK